MKGDTRSLDYGTYRKYLGPCATHGNNVHCSFLMTKILSRGSVLGNDCGRESELHVQKLPYSRCCLMTPTASNPFSKNQNHP